MSHITYMYRVPFHYEFSHDIERIWDNWNLFSHFSHLEGFSPVCILTFLEGWGPIEGFFHITYIYGSLSRVLSDMFVQGWEPTKCFPTFFAFIWFLSSLHSDIFGRMRANWRLSNIAYIYSSPVCILTCLCKDEGQLNAFPHCSHVYGFSPLWILTCLWKDVSQQ